MTLIVNSIMTDPPKGGLKRPTKKPANQTPNSVYTTDTTSVEIGKKVERGVTGIYAKGFYTNEEKMMLMCIAGRREIVEIRLIAYQVDPRAFISINNVREVYGKGFKKL